MSTYIDAAQLKEAIITAYTELRDNTSNARVSKKEFSAAVQKLPQYREVSRLDQELKNAKTKLTNIIEQDADIKELADDAIYYRRAVQENRDTLSTLLVRQAVKNKNASVDIGEANPHAIILTAKLGQEAPEQLDLFDDDADTSAGITVTGNEAA